MKFRFMEKRSNRILSIDKVLESVARDFDFEESFLVSRVRELWPDIVGQVIATHSIPDRIYKRVLYVSVDHPVYSNEIIMIEDRIRERINDMLGFESFKKIRAEVKRIKWSR